MPSVLQLLQDAFCAAIQQAAAELAAASELAAGSIDPMVAAAQNEQFGDYQCNAALPLAKKLKTNPRALAGKIVEALARVEGFDLGQVGQVDIAGPGFINVRLHRQFMARQLAALAADPRLGVPAQRRATVVVDYSSPNVAKEMHVGHLRTTIIGDCFARLLDFLGHRVIRQNHVGDWGTQFGMLVTYLAELPEHAQADLSDLTAFYQKARQRFDGDELFQQASRQAVVALQAHEAATLARWQSIVQSSRHYFQRIYGLLGVLLTDADERGESFYNPMLPGVVKALLDGKVAEESEGAIVVRTAGYETPLIIRKTDGGYLYGTTDLAALRYRVNELKADRIIYVVGAPQTQHLRQVFDAARQAGWAEGVTLEHAAFGSVLGDDGKILRTRAGAAVKLEDLLLEACQRALDLVTTKNPDLPDAQKRAIAQAVGIGAVKYADLSKDRQSDYVFSFDAMIATDGNTAPYLQYAHARVCAIFRKAGIDRAGLEHGTIELREPGELNLARHLLRFADVLAAVARDLRPHLLCAYLYELATRFSAFYESCDILKAEAAMRQSRLTLAHLTARTLAQGLDLLGIEHPEQM